MAKIQKLKAKREWIWEKEEGTYALILEKLGEKFTLTSFFYKQYENRAELKPEFVATFDTEEEAEKVADRMALLSCL